MTDAVVTGLILGFALVISVGPVIFTLLKLRINYGIVSAFYFISGVWISDILWVVTANFFGNLLGEVVTYKEPIGLAGGILLICIGVYYLFIKKYHSKEEMEAGIKIKKSTHIGLFFTGFFINTLNPGVIALWFAATTKSITHSYNERIVIFTICLLINMTADVFKINLAGKLRKKLTYKNIIIINKASGVLFLIFGFVLVVGMAWALIKN